MLQVSSVAAAVLCANKGRLCPFRDQIPSCLMLSTRVALLVGLGASHACAWNTDDQRCGPRITLYPIMMTSDGSRYRHVRRCAGKRCHGDTGAEEEERFGADEDDYIHEQKKRLLGRAKGTFHG